MSPLKKRIKRSTSDADADTVSATTPSLSDLDTFYTTLLDQIRSNNTSNDNNLSSSLLTLKAWQQELLMHLEASQSELDQAYKQRERQQRALAALTYEKEYLDGELEHCRNFEMKYLKKLAHEEAGVSEVAASEDKNKTGDSNAADAPSEQLLSNFLQANVHDPNDKQMIIARLHQELNGRGSLGRDLKLKQQELQTLKQELQSQTNFLQSLPDHLASLERASLPLQKFMTTKQPKSSSSSINTARMIGTERQLRLQLAQALPPPLYTLFQQLQHYLDRPSLAEDGDDDKASDDTSAIALTVTSGDSDNKQVILQLPVPDVSSKTTTRTKRVSIHFHYNAGLVSALASGCGTTLNQDVLLDELFPGDRAESVSGGVGRPYHWCNYLAGLHTVPESSQETTSRNKSASTRVVVRELQRRVRANATLKHILHSLQRKHVPLPPGSSRTTDGPVCKLVKFSKAKNSHESPQKTFNVSLSKGNEMWHVQVDMHMARYPSVPPIWTLNMVPDKDDDQMVVESPLYNDRLAALERYVNVDGLEELVAAQGDDSDETAYEWILLLQLRHILQTLGDSENIQGRKFKGRDRAPVTQA